MAISKIHAVTPAGMLPGLSLFSKQSEIGSTLQAYSVKGTRSDRLTFEEMV
ncbi:MAG TPA: hypothetical protein VEJ00_15150 [Candidatus Acidoferrales bacterium]|nr:hypothetical protein [Candidatus Acidoferrales bacterium]